jgi:hypothetical protein
MEDYYYIYKAENRSKAHGSNCDKLSFVDRFSFEKLHHKFCKAVLGIKKTSCNISAKSDLGRLPLDSFIKTQVMLYYSRIQSDGINPLVKEAFNINKNISNENIYTWYTFATEIFKEVELNKNWSNRPKLGRKQLWKVLYGNCSFRFDPLTNRPS